MATSYLPLAEPLATEAAPRRSGKALVLSGLLLGLGCALLWSQVPSESVQYSVPSELAALPWKSLGQRMETSGMRAATSAAALLRQPGSTQPQQFYKNAMGVAIKSGVQEGCRGSLVCMRAVGLFFGTQTGKTEDAAGMIGSEAGGLEAKDIADASASDLAGFDGLIVGAPTWNTGADEQRSGTGWDDYLEEIRGMDLGGKPVAVFGVGDSYGYGDNFCDAIEELHSTFEAAGAKMVGYVSSEGYAHGESKSDVDGKFLGLPLDQDNEDDKTESRVKSWISQIKGEGMPLM